MVTMARTPVPPDGLPHLSRGSHLSPEAGACFMEYASLLAGEEWSDQPQCTHPVLGELARMVNDSIGSAARQRLLRLVPSVIGLTSDDPRTAPLLVDALVGRAEQLGVRSPTLHWHRRQARRRLHRIAARRPAAALVDRLRALRDFAYREGPAVRAVDAVGYAVCQLPPGRRDDGLEALLETGIATLRSLAPAADPDRARAVRPRGAARDLRLS